MRRRLRKVNLIAVEGSHTSPKPRNQMLASLNGLVFALCLTEQSYPDPEEP
jgi:hypothetical protein